MRKKSLTRRQVIQMLAITGVTNIASPYIGASKALAKGGSFVLEKNRQFRMQIDRNAKKDCDVVLIGGGIMCATLATLLTQLSPDIKIEVYERRDIVAGESSGTWNNAGTGHSALCELNYAPEMADGSVDIRTAYKVTEAFEISKQFWASLVTQGRFTEPHNFINSTPHMSLVWGDKDAAYLKKRFEKMNSSNLYKGMAYSEDQGQLAEWLPLVMQGKNLSRKMAASRSDLGTDVNFGNLTRSLFNTLTSHYNVTLFTSSEVHNLRQDSDKAWHLDIHDRKKGSHKTVKTGVVFIGAGGGALPLLEKSGIVEGQAYGGFPVGGQFFVCKNESIAEKHHVKAYGKAGVGTPPMSVPHLDSRIVDGKRVLLFGPYAGFTTQFLKDGSFMDLPASIDIHNIKSMLGAGYHNIPLTKYLIDQVRQSPEQKFSALQEFVPDARLSDWELIHAGQRVQVIKGDQHQWGILEFGTEIVSSADGSIAALLGASPGASTSVASMIDVLNRCFKDQMKSEAWNQKLRELIPTYGQHLLNNAALTEKTRSWSHGVLDLTFSPQGS